MRHTIIQGLLYAFRLQPIVLSLGWRFFQSRHHEEESRFPFLKEMSSDEEIKEVEIAEALCLDPLIPLWALAQTRSIRAFATP